MESGEVLIEVLVFLVLIPLLAGGTVTGGVGRLARSRGLPPHSVRTIRFVITVIWVSIAAAGLSIAFGPFSFLSTLTASAIAGIALSLSLQTTLQNIISGSILVRSHFLRLGDEVSLSGVRGVVVGIGIVTVVLRAHDGTLTSISNGNMLSGPLTNYTASDRLSAEY